MLNRYEQPKDESPLSENNIMGLELEGLEEALKTFPVDEENEELRRLIETRIDEKRAEKLEAENRDNPREEVWGHLYDSALLGYAEIGNDEGVRRVQSKLAEGCRVRGNFEKACEFYAMLVGELKEKRML